MKRITLFALCMLGLGSGSAMAGALAKNPIPIQGSGFWTEGFTIIEGPSQYFDVISVSGLSAGSFYSVPGLINALRAFDDGYGAPAGWSQTGPGGTIAYTGGGPHGTPLHYSTTAVGFDVAFSGTAPTTGTLTGYINLFEVPFGTSQNEYTTSTPPIDSYEVIYNPGSSTPWTFEESNPAPEPSLVLLLGIGLGAVGLIVWRRGA